MNWEQIIGQKNSITTLIDSIDKDRVSHAQLFLGEEGYGVLPIALAYAQEILAREHATAANKVAHLNHLDLHFSFPVYSVSNKALSKNFFEEWRTLILENPYADFNDFAEILDAQNKQLFISADEVETINQDFALKSFEGGTKILIVWRADKMNQSAANKFLKFLEEPPKNTVILLTAENADTMLPTILSRCQLVEIPRIEDDAIAKKLQENSEISDDRISEIVHQSQGNYNTALKLLHSENANNEFEDLFIFWVRNAFQARKKPQVLKEIVLWGRNIAGWNREKQKQFLDFCAEIFRLALLQNYGSEELVYKAIKKDGFKWEPFSTYIHGMNIESILHEISLADLHLSRNGNAKIIWTDLGIKLTRFIHQSAKN